MGSASVKREDRQEWIRYEFAQKKAAVMCWVYVEREKYVERVWCVESGWWMERE